MAASFQRVTRRVLRRTPALGDSTMFVVARQRCSDGGAPRRLMVKHSSMPSRKLTAASGQSPSYHWAKPRLSIWAPSRQAARIAALA